jgi:hypothetical protein
MMLIFLGNHIDTVMKGNKTIQESSKTQLLHRLRWGYFTTDCRSVNMSWYRVPLWDLRPDITSCPNVAVWNLRTCFCGAPSLTRGRGCNLQYSLIAPSRAEPVTKLYCLIWDSPNLEGQVPVFISPRNRMAIFIGPFIPDSWFGFTT